MNLPVKLPALPFPAFDPPERIPSAQAQAEAAVESNKDQEVFPTSIDIPASGVNNGGPAFPEEILVYQTKAVWEACDVYVQIVPNLSAVGTITPGTLSIFIYAVTAGVRVLVASGRQSILSATGVNSTLSQSQVKAKWLAGIRSAAQKFEVTAQWTQQHGSDATTGKINIAVVAQNEAVAVPPDVGLEFGNLVYGYSSLASIGVNGLPGGVQIPNRLELVRVRAVNGTATPRFLQLFDGPAAPAAGAVPLAVWPLGDVIGKGIPDVYVGYRCHDRIQVVTSSTMNTLTAANDCSVSGWLR